jgi:hypothetical protein
MIYGHVRRIPSKWAPRHALRRQLFALVSVPNRVRTIQLPYCNDIQHEREKHEREQYASTRNVPPDPAWPVAGFARQRLNGEISLFRQQGKIALLRVYQSLSRHCSVGSRVVCSASLMITIMRNIESWEVKVQCPLWYIIIAHATTSLQTPRDSDPHGRGITSLVRSPEHPAHAARNMTSARKKMCGARISKLRSPIKRPLLTSQSA